MFNLLRRRSRKKKTSKANTSPATSPNLVDASKRKFYNGPTNEHYRPLTESDTESADGRRRVVARAAVIDELDDDLNDTEDEKELVSTSGRKERRFYFESKQRQSDDRRTVGTRMPMAPVLVALPWSTANDDDHALGGGNSACLQRLNGNSSQTSHSRQWQVANNNLETSQNVAAEWLGRVSSPTTTIPDTIEKNFNLNSNEKQLNQNNRRELDETVSRAASTTCSTFHDRSPFDTVRSASRFSISSAKNAYDRHRSEPLFVSTRAKSRTHGAEYSVITPQVGENWGNSKEIDEKKCTEVEKGGVKWKSENIFQRPHRNNEKVISEKEKYQILSGEKCQSEKSVEGDVVKDSRKSVETVNSDPDLAPVKLRRSSKNSTNTTTNEAKEKQKRQSRLSLTFAGLTSTKTHKENEVDRNSAIFSESDNKLKHSAKDDRPLGALKKSKEFLSDLFMARGRNNQRHRNTQQQQQHNAPVAATAVSMTDCEERPRSRSRSLSNSRVGATAAMPTYQNSHKQSTTMVNRSQSSSSIHLETVTDGGQHYQQSHIIPEMKAINGDPAASHSCPLSTNSYQMTESKNSPQNFSQIHGAPKEQREHTNQSHHNSVEYSAENERVKNNESAPLSVGRESGAQPEQKLNGYGPRVRGHDEAQFNRATNIVRNGVRTATVQPTTTADCAEEHKEEEEEVETCEEKEEQEVPLSLYDVNRLETNAQNAIANGNAIESEVNGLFNGGNVLNGDETVNDMGQTNGKPESFCDATSLPRPPKNWEFRESRIPPEDIEHKANDATTRESAIVVPKITVVDYSDNEKEPSSSSSSSPGGPNSLPHQEIFYEFEQEDDQGVRISPVEVDETDDFYQHEEIPATGFPRQWSPSHLRRTLDQVPEEEDEYDEEGEPIDTAKQHSAVNLDSESPECNALNASANASDSNLSTSFLDSGIGESQVSSGSSRPPTKPQTSYEESTRTHSQCTSFRSPTPTRSSGASTGHYNQQLPFVRDGSSTDCDDTLMPGDEELDFVLDSVDDIALQPNERLVCIESISLPDVVVESTTAVTGSNTASLASTSAITTTTPKSSTTEGEHIININGATGNSMGNVHFIPIHVEGDNGRTSPKRRIIDDSVIGCGASMKSFAPPSKPTIEIIEDDSESCQRNSTKNFFAAEEQTEKLKKELADQKSRYNVQLEDAQKNVQNLQNKISDMQDKIGKLEQELASKAWNVERLQGELSAAQTDDEYVRKKLKLLEDEKTHLRHKYDDTEDEFKRKYDELEAQYKELEEKYKNTQSLASSLQTQLAAAQTEVEEWRQEVQKIRAELEDQIRILKNALENSEAERKICQDKWQKEFEMLRTQNQDREESLMTDCEWQLRQMQKQCKDKMDKLSYGRQEALERAERLGTALEERDKEVENLKTYEAEVKSLRSVVTEQERSIQTLMSQIENLKADLKTANDNLEDQIEAVKKIKYQCDNAIYDKERQTLNRIEEIRQEAAAFWEDKLYTEMTRLKCELESVYVDERREALDKLQGEHIEELRALTTRYTANEEELRNELSDVQERLDSKNSEFLELREKTDNDLLKTRMHLDRADREYQAAMCREEQRREDLEEALRKEFEQEKQEMEEKFRERLGQVKEEFARELQISTQNMIEQHHKNLEQQKSKLLAERDEALQELAERHRKKLEAAEDKIRDVELRHSRDLKDLKAAYDAEKASLDKRDISNANEIEQLHRKCRCLTNLFEEMRMRYERRDPRQEDLREISELRSRCESQERDLYDLTDRLREMQIEMSRLQGNAEPEANKVSKPVKKPPPKTIPTSCDVIYEENEERESPPPAVQGQNQYPMSSSEDDDEEEEEVEKERVAGEGAEQKPTPVIEELQLNDKPKNLNTINEDDSHMITAV